jgi:hypothetical protein
MLTIPAPPLVAEPDAYEPPPLDGDSLDTLAKLAAHERAAATADPTVVNCCPDCRAMLPDGAVLCTSCGLNLQTGKRLKTAIADKKTATPKTPAQGGVLSRFLRRPGR